MTMSSRWVHRNDEPRGCALYSRSLAISGVTLESVAAFLDFIAQQFAHELKPVLAMKSVTSNSELLGSYAEAALRKLIRRAVQPMNICTGAVLEFPMPQSLRQLDLIIWSAFPVPALFDVEEFGIVPQSSVFGLIEIKRSNYTEVDQQLEDFLAAAPQLIPLAPEGGRGHALGLICVLTKKPSERLQKLIDEGRVSAMLDATAGSEAEPEVRTADVLGLLNFLAYVTHKFHVMKGKGVFQVGDYTGK